MARANHEGSIRKRQDGRVEVRMLDSAGKRKSVYVKTLADGKWLLRDYQEKLDKGIPVVLDRQTVVEDGISSGVSAKRSKSLALPQRHR